MTRADHAFAPHFTHVLQERQAGFPKAAHSDMPHLPHGETKHAACCQSIGSKSKGKDLKTNSRGSYNRCSTPLPFCACEGRLPTKGHF